MDDEPRDPFADAAARRSALAGKTIRDELPPDPDLEDLPDELRLHPGPFFIDGVEVSRENVSAGFADARRARETDDA